MKAVLLEEPGGPEVLRIKEIDKPEPREGWVLIQIKAFGLNRSEMFTRQGHDFPQVQFPRVPGIECVGIVEAAPGTEFKTGQKVATMMGGLGRKFHGGYAEYTLAPASHVFPMESSLEWSVLGAIPEMFQTAWGSLYQALQIQTGETLLIRGGTSSVGMTATRIAKRAGLTVLATTRSSKREHILLENGVDHVVIDNGSLEGAVKAIYPKGVNKVLELIGTKTLIDSLHCVTRRGTVCMTGILGNEWTFNEFTPMHAIPSTVHLTCYSGSGDNLPKDVLQDYIEGIESGEYQINIDKIFKFSDIVEAHRYMEENRATGKLVVVH